MDEAAEPRREINLQVPPSNVLTLTNVPAINPENFVKWAKIDILKGSPGIVALDYFQDDRIAVVTYKNSELRNNAAEIAMKTIPSGVGITRGYDEVLPNETTPEYIGKLKTGLTPNIEENKRKQVKQPEPIKIPKTQPITLTSISQQTHSEENVNIVNNNNNNDNDKNLNKNEGNNINANDGIKYPNAVKISKYVWVNKMLSFFVYIKFMLLNRYEEMKKNIPDMSLITSNLLVQINNYKYEFIIGILFIIFLIILKIVVLE